MSKAPISAPPDDFGPVPPVAEADPPSSAKAADPLLQHAALAPGLAFQPLTAGLAGGFALQQVQVWQGQFPPPDAVERYEQVLPGAFDRIMTMAERQQEASIAGSAEARRYLREDSRRGHWLGWLVTVVALVCALVCAILGQPWVAGMLVAVPVMGVAKALVDSARTPSPPKLSARTPATTKPDRKPDHAPAK